MNPETTQPTNAIMLITIASIMLLLVEALGNMLKQSHSITSTPERKRRFAVRAIWHIEAQQYPVGTDHIV